ncbi:MAG: leucine-rich repeat domain-containing protein [Candidatus Heimdallarchaeota archaeon]
MSEKEFIKKVETLIKNKEYKKALKIAEKEAKNNPDNPFAWYGKGYCLFHLKKYKKALDALKLFVSNKRANVAIGYYFMGECHKAIKDYPQAIINYKISHKHKPKHRPTLYGLEFSYRQLNDVENAIHTNLLINELYPRDIHSWYWLSILFLKKQDAKRAFSYILRGIMKRPDEEELRAQFRLILEEFNKSRKSSQEISALSALELNDFGNGTLNFDDKEIGSIEEIKDFEYVLTNLHYLHLESNEIQKISFPGKLPELKSLYLNDNCIAEITDLDKLPVLKTLHLEGNEICNIEELRNLTQLVFLFLDDNHIEKIQGLDNLVNLVHLHINGNHLVKIEGLDKLDKLFDLRLCNNQIVEIDGLENLPRLERLHLANNQINKINGIGKLEQLKILNLANNKISTMKDFSEMSNLESLDLSFNNLETIDNLELFPKLKNLNLRNNPALPKIIAKKHKGKQIISKLKKYSGLSIEEFQEIARKEKERQKILQIEVEERRKLEKERRISKLSLDGFFGSEIISNYGLEHNLLKRVRALMKLNELSSCLYCKDRLPDDAKFALECESAIKQLISDTGKTLPLRAKNRDSYIEREYIETVTNRRMDIYDRPGYSTVVRKVKEYFRMSIGYHKEDDFPKLQGYICNNCSNEFIRKAAKIFKRLQRRRYKETHFADKIQKSMRKTHENYMKLFESFIEKRGF